MIYYWGTNPLKNFIGHSFMNHNRSKEPTRILLEAKVNGETIDCTFKYPKSREEFKVSFQNINQINRVLQTVIQN